jgi:hypothetical protein
MAEDLQNTAVDTAPVAETVAEQGTVAEVKVDTAPVAETTPVEEMVSKKELEKARMRANQLENQLEEYKVKAQTAGNDDLVYDLQSQLDELKAEREREANEAKLEKYESTLSTVFDKTLEQYPEHVKEAARFIREKQGISTLVGDAQFTFEAEKNIKDFLDGLDGRLKVEKPEIKVDAQNLPYTPPTPEEVKIGEGAQNMGAGEEDLLSRIAKESFKSIGIEL